MKILLSNDDGVYDRGIVLMANRLAGLGYSVTVVAPDRERSGAGHAISPHSLHIHKVDFSGYGESVRVFKCNGTPADCVMLGLNVVAPDTELVLTGINSGPNLGCDVFYSGTAAAAREGYFENRRSVAVSLCMSSSPETAHYETALAAVESLVADVDVLFGDAPAFLNMNVPNIPPSEVKGFRMTFAGRRRYRDRVQVTPDPDGGKCYWVAGTPADDEERDGSDVTAVNEGFVALTFLKCDTTDYDLNGRIDFGELSKIKLR